MPDLPDAPLWVTVALAVASLVVGNVIKPIIGNRATAAESLRDDMMKYASQVKADADSIREQNDRLFSALIVNNTQLVVFQGFVLREGTQGLIAVDAGDLPKARTHFDELIGGAQKLNVTSPYWNKENRDS